MLVQFSLDAGCWNGVGLVFLLYFSWLQSETMGITTVTRKSLWAKSGNRCAICRLELVQNEEGREQLIIGQECHIVSSKPDGPRGDQELHCSDFDDFENLLLLCANDHKRIDTLIEIYSVEKLVNLKKSHEEWVKSTLSVDPLTFTNDELKISSLKRVESGGELIQLVDGAHAFMLDSDSLKTKEEVELIPPLLDLLKEYGDVLDLMGFREKAELGLELDERIQKIETLGFQIFGHKRNVKFRNNLKEDMGRWDMTTIVIVRNDNPGIIDGFLITSTPEQYRFRI